MPPRKETVPCKATVPELFDKAANLLKELISPCTVTKACVQGTADVVPFVVPDELRDKLGNLVVNSPGSWTPKQQASVLALSRPAPVGKDIRTVVDTSIRKAKEILAEKLVIRNSEVWSGCLDRYILPQVVRGLWPDRTSVAVVARFYKMTLYEEGDFFKAHRDTLREDSHFGTLVVVLPSNGVCSGGELVVHDADGQKSCLKAPGNKGEVAWTAFFANVLHEVLPVTQGVRIAMLYHIHRVATPQIIPRARAKSSLPPLAACLKEISTCVSASKEEDEDDNDGGLWQSTRPAFAGFLLDHAYGGRLSAEKLQGGDRTLYDAVSSFMPGTRLANIDIRLHGPGGGDEDGCTRQAKDMHGIIAEIDEVNLQNAPKRKSDGSGAFSKAVYPARPLSVVCVRHFDCATDVMDNDEKVNTVRWVVSPAVGTNQYGWSSGAQGQTIIGGLLERILKLKALERRVNGTGNEGSEAYFLFRHAALLCPLKKGAEGKLDRFSHAHAQRHHPDYNP